MEGTELVPVPALSVPASLAAQPPSSSISSRLAGLIRSMAGVRKDEKKDDAMCRRLQSVRVKFIRLVHRLGQSPDSGIAAQVLYRFALAEQLKGGSTAGNDKASAVAMEEESSARGEIDFCCNVLLLGKSGVGKSATINAILDKPMTEASAFQGTESVRVVTGTVKGIQVKFIDTPGLSPCAGDRRRNEWVVSSVKRCLRKTPPDIVLYVDRLDSKSKDVQLMRFISDRFGPAIWFNAIIVLTHGASAPPDAFDGLPMNYDTYVSQRTRVVQNAVRAAVGDERLMNPVSLVENHSACRLNKAGERVLPNGMVWRPELLLLCFSARILAEANLILKLPESMPLKSMGTRRSGSPMPVLLASLLQSRSEVQQPQDEEFGYYSSEEFDESDEDTEYDQLPPFRRLNEDELAELDKKNRASYFEELALRERLYRKKLWKMQCKKLQEIKMNGMQDEEEEIERRRGMSPGVSAETPVPTSFDSDDPTHRYRYIDDVSWLVRPVSDGRGMDHENAFDAAHMEKSFCIGKKIPVSLGGQIRKDKKETSITFDGSAAYRHSEDKVTTGGLDIQTVGKDICYSLWTGTCFKNLKQNKTMAGMGATMVGNQAVVGVRLEDKLVIGKRFKVVGSIATSLTKGDAAYGGIMEATVVGPDYPADRSVCTVGLSVMNWTQKDVALGANLQSQFTVLDTNMVIRANVNNRGTGQITVKANSSQYIEIGLFALLPLLRTLFRNRLFRLDFW